MPLVDHVDLVVSSIDRSLPFYRDLLAPLGWVGSVKQPGERDETIHYLWAPDFGGSLGLRESQSEPDGSPCRPSAAVSSQSPAEDILRRARAIPPGFVATYSDLCPSAPRLAGRVLSETDDPGVPWQRVVRADGTLAKGERQRRLLRAEGAPFDGTRIAMSEARIPVEELDELSIL